MRRAQVIEVFVDANDLEVFELLTYLRAHFPDRLRTRTRDRWLYDLDREKVQPFMECLCGLFGRL